MIYAGILSTINFFNALCLPAQLISPHLGKVNSKELDKKKENMKHDMYMKDFVENELRLDTLSVREFCQPP